MIKLTRAGKYGLRGLDEYLTSLERSNELLGAGNSIEGAITDLAGCVRLVTSQPYVKGEAAPVAEIDRVLAEKGYYRAGAASFFNPDTEEVINDAFPRNVLQSADGRLHFIDVSFRQAPADKVDIFTAVARQSCHYPGF